LFSSSVGTTVISNAPMPYSGGDFTLAASTYTFTVTVDGVQKWQQTGCVIADGHIFAIPNIGDRDSGATAGVVKQVL
jgi:hypothetical protein